MPSPHTSGALSRFRVIDLSQVRAGPTCVKQLADFGADVIKVEPPPGGRKDIMTGERDGADMQNLHRNKRSLTLDLKSADGKAILLDLVRSADVVVENFRPDVKYRLGIDYDSLAAINPRIVLDLRPQFLTPANLGELLDVPGDLVLDACDSFRSKVEAIAYCRRRKQPIITVGSAGGRSDVTQIRVRDLSRTEHDAMLSLIRKKLRGEFNFPKNHDRYFGVPAVYSLENVRYPQADGSVCGIRPQLGKDEALKLDCGAGLGAATHVTGAFAFAAVGKAIELLLKPKRAG